MGNVIFYVTRHNVTITTIALYFDLQAFPFHLNDFIGKSNVVYLFYQPYLVNFNGVFYMLLEIIVRIVQAHKFSARCHSFAIRMFQ